MSAFELAQTFSNVSNKLIEEFEKNPNLYAKNDIQSISSDGWLIKYTVFIEKMSEEKAIEVILKILKWRQAKKFVSAVDTDFPSELYQLGSIFPYNQDKDGNLTLFFRLDRKLSQLGKLSKRFMMHQLNKFDKQINGNGRWVLVVDYSNSGLANLDLVFHLTKVIKYFPACRYIIHYNANGLVRKMIKHTQRKSVDKFSEKKQIFDHFHDNYLPQYLGGTCDQTMSIVPSDAVSILDCYKKLGLSKNVAAKNKQYFDKYITSKN